MASQNTRIQVGTLNDLVQTLDQDNEGRDASRRLENTLKWCEGLQRLCWGRFVVSLGRSRTALLCHADQNQRGLDACSPDWHPSIASALGLGSPAPEHDETFRLESALGFGTISPGGLG